MRQHTQRNDLALLRISLDWPEQEEREYVVFELSVRGDSKVTISVTSADVGLPEKTDDIRRFTHGEPNFSLPPEVINRIVINISQFELLWLELNPTSSRLALVPWERLLQPYFQCPILRVPVFQFGGTLTKWDSLDIVLCTSSPVAKEQIPIEYLLKLIVAIGQGRSKPTNLHLFTDSDNYQALSESVQYQGLDWVRLYNPEGAANYAPSEFSQRIIDDPQSLDNPWLNWIADAMGDLTVDVVHFACHGFFSMEQGSIAVAESPLQNQDSDWARFIGVQQLNNFLNRVGADTVFFSSPPLNYSISGLRLLADQVARLRRGAVLLYDKAGFTAFEDLEDISHIYHNLYCEAHHDLSPFPSLTFYCSPDLLDGLSFKKNRRDLFVSEDIPALRAIAEILNNSSKAGNTWLASSYRWLEETASALNEQPSSETQSRTQEGIRNAVEFLSDVTQRHASLRNRSSDQQADGRYEQEAE